ncbi:hypothetical protein SDC9_182913 [bioreactor metagenome]|uniref:Uncharacterized protein n=1 Tax=bioreactor metagenome TaxID=1076179 RepID=A0A645H8U4_9ZZZZ
MECAGSRKAVAAAQVAVVRDMQAHRLNRIGRRTPFNLSGACPQIPRGAKRFKFSLRFVYRLRVIFAFRPVLENIKRKFVQYMQRAAFHIQHEIFIIEFKCMDQLFSSCCT